MFLFVDRILELDPGRRAVGLSYVTTDPAFLAAGDPLSPNSEVPSVPPCLIGEAVGQLAAWAVMESNDFTLRPIGALIERVEILGRAHGGPVLLEVRLDEAQDDTLTYHGTARVSDTDVLRFDRAFSPLLPAEDFDSSERLRHRFEAIHNSRVDPRNGSLVGSAAAHGTASAINFDYDRLVSHEPGVSLVADKTFIGVEPFFADHFPRRPVVPLTVLMECAIRIARRLFGEGAEVTDTPIQISVRNTKINRFLHPGDRITTTVQLLERSPKGRRFRVRGNCDGRRVYQATVEFSVAGD